MPAVVWTLILASLVPELLLEGADAGLWGSPRWRAIAYGWGGFWPGLLQGWRPNYAGQPLAMFATYGFLHGGFSHMAGNMVTLAWLGLPLAARFGQARLFAIYAVSVIGGGIGYALLASAPVPMVGASGALFGMAGAWVVQDRIDRFAATGRIWPLAGSAVLVVLGLAGLNLFLWWTMDGQLAWETHLGGFVAGAATAAALIPATPPRPPSRG